MVHCLGHILTIIVSRIESACKFGALCISSTKHKEIKLNSVVKFDASIEFL